jgi:UDP-N-acetylglucosamine diphosphorylase/glucosamine-1-phosphate N-acetyltransferase
MDDPRNKRGNLQTEAVILAAGKGTRMKSNLAKVMHVLGGRPLLQHVLDTVAAAGIQRSVIVVGHQADRVIATFSGPDREFVRQEPQLGTGHAVQVAAPALYGDYCLVLAGDVPLLRAATLRRLVDHALGSGAAAVVLTCVVADAGAYGRVVKDDLGRVQRIVEARDANAAEKAIGEFNTGVFCFRTALLKEALTQLTTDNDQGEYYLTDTVAHLVGAGHVVEAVVTDDQNEVMGINTSDELAVAADILTRTPDR